MHRWARAGAIAGVTFVALYSIAFFGLQNLDFPPAGSTSAEEIAAFIRRERFRGALATLCSMGAWAAFLVFLAGVRSTVTADDSTRRLEALATGAGILVAGLSLAGAGLQAEVMLSDVTDDPTTLLSQWALYDASGGLSGVTPFLRAVFVGALSVVALTSPGAPRWFGLFGILVTALNVLGGVDFVLPVDWSLTGHPLLDLAAFLVWVLAASALLLVRGRQGRSS